jgi:putative nucleotidyltransferase with HDIG domain
VLTSARDEVVRLAGVRNVDVSVVASAVEQDPGLTAAVMRFARRHGAGDAYDVPGALRALGPQAIRALGERLPIYALDAVSSSWIDDVSRFRSHALAVRDVARRLAREAGLADDGALATAALLHDVGKLVLAQVHPEYPFELNGRGPNEWLVAERRAYGMDHTIVSALVARRWDLPPAVAHALERHHAPDATGLAALVGLADVLVHHASGARVSMADVYCVAARAGLGRERVAIVLQGPSSGGEARRAAEPCPLTPRQLELLRGLAEGKQYKQIAHDLELAPSTVRSHLHAAFGLLGVADRAQAVLLAAERGWIATPRISIRATEGRA